MKAMRLAGLAGILIVTASAQDPGLAALHVTLETLHSQREALTEHDGGSPMLTTAKHQLRDWIESQLGSIKQTGDEKKVSERINDALDQLSVKPADDDQNLLGSLGKVSLDWQSALLIVTTQVGIVCQHDESAYAYKQIDGKWTRVWESEQNDYENYAAQYISAVHVWQSREDGKEVGPAYIMTLGNEWGCASTWHLVYYRIWRLDSSGSKALIDRAEPAWLRGQTFAVGSIVQTQMHFPGPVDALVEFTEASVDGGVHNREAIRHFLIDGDRVRRVDPVALSPRDFVDEWLTRPWDESKEWSSSPSLRQSHLKLHADFVAGYFLGVTAHCQTPDLWQIGFEPHDAQKNFEAQPEVYFLIRWTPPYRFAMVGVSDKPWPRCTKPDPEADAWRTLFSTQEWRW
ncbi:MAG TPA: hypothetical protein VNX18_12290 [Bryobacteraceae bacterium]|nr:hypothetical protein [Bryobacteraceae bacterium]